MSTDIYDIYGPSDWVSDCCSAVGFLDICVEPGGKLAVGICSKCKDHASFTKEENGPITATMIRERNERYWKMNPWNPLKRELEEDAQIFKELAKRFVDTQKREFTPEQLQIIERLKEDADEPD